MSAPKEGSCDIGDGIIVCLTPDVCKTPVGSSLPPVPYSITAKQGDDANTVSTVRMTSKRAHNMASLVTKCTGDQPGSGTGIKSGTVGSVCHPKSHSGTVNIEGRPAIRHTDEWHMNNRNTVGKLTYVRNTQSFSQTPAIELYQSGSLDNIVLAEFVSPGGETIVDLPPIGESGNLPAPSGDAVMPVPQGEGPGIPTPENPRPGAGRQILNRLGRTPAVAAEIVDYARDGAVSRAQIQNQINRLEFYRDYYAERGYDADDLAQYDDAIEEMERLRDETTYDNRA